MGHGWKVLTVVAICGAAIPAHAVQFANRSFEQGDLTGWEAVGDVSIQTSAIGGSPTHGEYQALVTTLSSQGTGGYGGTPYSDNSALGGYGQPGSQQYFVDYLHVEPPEIPFDFDSLAPDSVYWLAFYHAMFTISSVRQDLSLRAGDRVLFDYSYITTELSYFFDPAWVYTAPVSDLGDILGPHNSVQYLPASTTPVEGSGPVEVDLCARWPFGICDPTSDFYRGTSLSGWGTFAWTAPTDGTYAFIVGVNQMDDWSGPTAMLLDNFRIRVPEPGTLALLSLGLLSLGFTARRRLH